MSESISYGVMTIYFVISLLWKLVTLWPCYSVALWPFDLAVLWPCSYLFILTDLHFQVEVDEEKTTLSSCENIPLSLSNSSYEYKKVPKKTHLIPSSGF
jgi:hypothetical protein